MLLVYQFVHQSLQENNLHVGNSRAHITGAEKKRPKVQMTFLGSFFCKWLRVWEPGTSPPHPASWVPKPMVRMFLGIIFGSSLVGTFLGLDLGHTLISRKWGRESPSATLETRSTEGRERRKRGTHTVAILSLGPSVNPDVLPVQLRTAYCHPHSHFSRLPNMNTRPEKQTNAHPRARLES